MKRKCISKKHQALFRLNTKIKRLELDQHLFVTVVPYFMKHMSKYERAASNLSHDLGPFLVVELQLCNSLVDAHPFDLWRRTKRRAVTMRQVFNLSATLKTTLTTGGLNETSGGKPDAKREVFKVF